MISHELLAPMQLNHLFKLKNKIVMAPMTRAKATDDLLPTQAMAEYYARRADVGLIITEGTLINRYGLGHWNVPGIFSSAQINHWRQVSDRVHQRNGLIFMQLWHVGRVSHPNLLNGQLPLSASATTMSGRVNRSQDLTYGQSRAATLSEIQELIADYAKAASNAMQAGFDGIEIHGANGYLIDQFLHYHTNQRDDQYGGTPENMARFSLEVIQAIGQTIGHERIGIRLSPGAYLNEMVGNTRDALVFHYLLEQLNKIPIAYVHSGNFNDTQKFAELSNKTMTEFMRDIYQGKIIACGSYSLGDALNGLQNKQFDLIAIGRPLIANADLVHRIATQQELKTYNNDMLHTLY